MYHYDCIQFVYLRTKITHHMSPASNYKRLLAKFKLTLPIGTSEICNYLLRMRKTVQRKDYITHCLQVILNAYMRCVGKIGQLVPQKHEITFCAGADPGSPIGGGTLPRGRHVRPRRRHFWPRGRHFLPRWAPNPIAGRRFSHPGGEWKLKLTDLV